MKITTGIVSRSQRVVVYGSPGIGKTTLGQCAPSRVLFLDTEDGTAHLAVARVRIASIDDLETTRQRLDPAKLRARGVRSLVVDTIDSVERYLREKLVRKYRVESIGQIRYGNGHVFLREEFGRFLTNFLDQFIPVPA